MRKLEGGRLIPTEQDEDYGAGAIHLMGLYVGGSISHLAFSHDGPWVDKEWSEFYISWGTKENFLNYMWDKDRELELEDVIEANQKLIPILFDALLIH